MRTNQACLRLVAIAAALFCASCATVSPSDSGQPALLIRNVTVIPMDTPGQLLRQDVLVVGSQIAAIAPTGKMRNRYTKTIDGTGKFLMPALWDMHTHLTVSEDQSAEIGTEHVAERLGRYLGYGIAGVRDTGSTLADLSVLKRILPTLTKPSARVLASGPTLDGKRTRWSGPLAETLDSAEQARAVATAVADAGADLFKTYETINRPEFLEVVKIAKARGLPVTGHVSFHLGVEEATAAGQTGIEHVYVSMIKDCLPPDAKPAQTVIGAWIKDGYEGRYREMVRLFSERDRAHCASLFQRLSQRGVFVTPVLSMEMRGAPWSGAPALAVMNRAQRENCYGEARPIAKAPREMKNQAEKAMLEVVRELHQAGVRLLAGADSPSGCIPFGYGLHRELQLLSEAGLSPLDVLRTATVNPAAYRREKNGGVVRASAPADLLLLDANPLADVANTLRIAGMTLGGQWFDRETLEALRKVEEPTTRYGGALVWQGDRFVQRDLFVRDGVFVSGPVPGSEVRDVTLSGKFIVPAYGNAHAHLTSPTPQSSWSFLRNGVFYVWNPNTVVVSPEAMKFFDRKDTVDVRVAQGGITEPGGHPERIYVELLNKWVYGNKPREWFIGNAFHYGRDRTEIDSALDLLKSQGASLVKTYLLHSEEYRQRRDDPKQYGFKGLNPDNFAYLVNAARTRGLPVAVHVETRHDLMVAARAGAAIAAHLPAYHARQATLAELDGQRLSKDDAEFIARSGMLLVPTYALAEQSFAKDSKEPATLSRVTIEGVQAQNIRLLKQAGAAFLIGTDTQGPIFAEVEHLVRIGGLTPAEAVQIALGTGARLFPERRLGCFEAGCEADFVILSANPSVDIRNLRQIAGLIKAGQELRPPPTSK